MSLANDVVALDIHGLAPRLKMYIHGDEDQIISARLRKDHCWEAYETQLTLQYLKAGDVYVDVGANIGYYTVVAAERVGALGKVIAYEPNPANYTLLQHNVALNQLPQVQLFPYALYDQDAEGTLFLSGDNFGDHRIYAAEEARDSHAITLVHGAEHLRPLTEKINFLKIDTQGAEFFVLNGLKSLILQNRAHLHMIVEFCPYGIRHSGADAHEVVRLLESLEMPMAIIDHQQQQLIPVQPFHLHDWVDELANEPANEGFLNLLLRPQAV